MNDEEFSISILPRVSRTFALSIEALPEPLRSTIRVSYLLCRVVDTIEDEPDIERDRRQELFKEFARVVQNDEHDLSKLEREFADWTGNDDRELCRNVGAPVRIFRSLPRNLADAARPHIVEMASGMAEYALRWEGPRSLTVLKDAPDLERYCYYVAGTVGNLLTQVFLETHSDLDEEKARSLTERAVGFGLGLQLTNISKDVTDDRARGWCFLPEALCEARGIAPGDLLDPSQRKTAMLVLQDVVAMAKARLEQALEYTLLLPPSATEVRLFVLVPLALALSTVSLVEKSPDVLDPETAIKVSRQTVALTLIEAQRVVGDDAGIKELCRKAAALELV